MELLTIGHSNHSSEAFIALLQQHGVTILADVRSHPYSRYLPYFNQANLRAALSDVGINYLFLGRELGARPNEISCYVDGKAIYEKIAATELFSVGIQQILTRAKTNKISLMCAEKDPITCHRSILVCQKLRHKGLTIQHILPDGSTETHQNLESRLLNLHALQPPKNIQLSLFSEQLFSNIISEATREAAIKEAYSRQGEKIAYIEKNSNEHN